MEATAPSKPIAFWAVIIITALSLAVSLWTMSNVIAPLRFDPQSIRTELSIQAVLLLVSGSAKAFLLFFLFRRSRLAVFASLIWLLSLAASFAVTFHSLGYGRILPGEMATVFWLGWALQASVLALIWLTIKRFLKVGFLK